MLCDDKWCSKCYVLSIPLPEENDENEIEFGVFELQLSLQFKYFDNYSQGIRPKKAHKIDARYNLRYPEKNTLVLQPKSLTKINLKITLKIPPGAIVQITSRSSLASKGINIRGGEKSFKIEHAEKIAQAIYLPLINILGLQSVNNREQLEKSEIGTQGFWFNWMIYSSKHHEIYTCSKPTTTQQIFESNEQIYKNPQIVSNFIKIVRHTLLPNPNIIPITENYHLLEEKLSRINMGPLKPQQQRQLKQLITEFADIFAKDNNDLRKTDMV
ncbi:hypothetical protein G9A89_005433 [Geosiphon pyriformis]|nr:hypothetical protein G9A89_005433 [Geosiphon pyriformis]